MVGRHQKDEKYYYEIEEFIMDNKIKKQITEEWLRAFLNLSGYTQNKLYKVIGPFICGIEIINLPRSENYRPHFVIYPLYKKDIKFCLEYPALMFEFYNYKKLQLNLPYDDVNGNYKEAQNIVSKSLKISLEKNVTLNSFYGQINDILQTDVEYNSHSGKIASLLELKFYAALYAGDEDQIKSVISQIQNESKVWNMQIFETWYGKFDKWLQSLQATKSNRNEFLKQIEANRQDKKIAQLKSSELTA